MTSPLLFNAAPMYTASHAHHGQWRRPEAIDPEFNDVRLWIELAKKLEAACFDGIFFPDISGHHGPVDVPIDTIVEEGLQLPSNDPLVLLSALATHTEHIGLAFTSSILQSQPFTFARQISTLDHISGGRASWNIVTGWQHNGARNFGLKGLPEHDSRYEWAEEYVEVAYKLWEGSWDEGALLKDRKNSRFSDPSKVHKIYHEGPRYRVEGPHLPSPSPQRTPFLYQAGASRAGRTFAARHAEGVFLATGTPEGAREQIEQTRTLAVEHGRRPEDIKFFPGLSFIVGDTAEEARAKADHVRSYISAAGLLAHMAVVDENGRAYPLDTPLSEVTTPAQQGSIERARSRITDREPVVEDLAYELSSNPIVGTPEQIADELEHWRDAGADGINVMSYILNDYAEFADKVIPVLQERGLAKTQYNEGSYRKKIFGQDLVNERHPAASYRGAFTNGPRSWDEATAQEPSLL
jgi:FMN-dependent oxidoreductase (nitrilotriacetate monooxygenase family)